jgi:hypothetical protein
MLSVQSYFLTVSNRLANVPVIMMIPTSVPLSNKNLVTLNARELIHCLRPGSVVPGRWIGPFDADFFGKRIESLGIELVM